MKALVSLAALAVSLLTARAQAIDFTQRFYDAVEDGVPMRHMYFSDGAQRILYRPHASWLRSGDAQAAIFVPKGSVDASVKIENAPLGSAGIPFDEHGLVTLRKAAGALLPPDATAVTQSLETVNPVVLQGWTSCEIGFDYLQSGRHRTQSVLFINLNPRLQIHLIISAQSADFQSLHEAAYRSLASWSELPLGTAP